MSSSVGLGPSGPFRVLIWGAVAPKIPLQLLPSTVMSLASLPSSVPRGTKVYKDDCMYSFDTAENNANGIDVCLHCFQAFARGFVNYTQRHTARTGHAHYLNIVKTAKPARSSAEANPAKYQKLEVKDVADEDLFDTAYRVYDAAHNRTEAVAETPANVQSLIADVVSANSSARQDEIKTWEHEVFPCEHSASLVPTGHATDLTQCGVCGLKENLWICLHCGSVGCGRQQFGSTLKGNGHALEHFERHPTHPVAIKLGSLDLDNYDCYCYQCNDEVKVPDLATHLLRYGIDISTLVKTEKNLIELNLDQNINWDFKLDGANGEKLEPVFGAELTGLQNLGNSCYLNSVVQALFSLPEYQQYFAAREIPEIDDPAGDLATQLVKVYDGLCSGRYSVPSVRRDSSYQMGLRPSMLKALVGANHPEFQTQRQQDAFEFLLYFLELSTQKLGAGVNDMFQFVIENKIKCVECHHVTLKDELVDSVSLPIRDVVLGTDPELHKRVYELVDMHAAFSEYCAPELLEDFKCTNCQAQSMVKSIGFKSYPRALLINAKRIKLENWVPVKVDVPIEIPQALSLDLFRAKAVEVGEVVVEDNDESDKFAPNEGALNSLLGMGFPEPRCIKALYHTGNSDAEEAMTWLFAHMEDPDIDLPLVAGPSEVSVSVEAIENLVSMGFSALLAKKSLVVTSGDTNAAVDWLFNNPNDDGVIETASPVASPRELIAQLEGKGSPGFRLKAVVCHKGSSPHTGHYVAFVRKVLQGEEKWVLFNDEKVVVCGDDLSDVITNGYVYVFVGDKEQF